MTAISLARRPALSSKSFIFTLAAIGLLLALALVPLALKAHARHVSVAELTRARVFLIENSIVAGDSVADAGVAGVNTDSNGNTIKTTIQNLAHKGFVLHAFANDGYAYQYDSRTGFYTGGCNLSPTCWLGINK